MKRDISTKIFRLESLQNKISGSIEYMSVGRHNVLKQNLYHNIQELSILDQNAVKIFDKRRGDNQVHLFGVSDNLSERIKSVLR